MSGWVKVTPETMPRIGTVCHIVIRGYVQHMPVEWRGNEEGFVWIDSDEQDPPPMEIVTHWQPLPQPPEEK